jgi:hypothetical protein
MAWNVRVVTNNESVKTEACLTYFIVVSHRFRGEAEENHEIYIMSRLWAWNKIWDLQKQFICII